MDKQNYIPEEEAYLRMLDREVPDLWGRIEAGLDAAEAQGSTPSTIQTPMMHTAAEDVTASLTQTREQRFLAEQQAANVVAFDTANRKTKSTGKKKIWIVAGIAAAAAVLVISLAVFGFSRRDSKLDATTDTNNEVAMDISGSSGASAKSQSAKQTMNVPSDMETDDIASLAPQKDRNASKGEASYSSAVTEEEQAEQNDSKEDVSVPAAESRDADGMELDPKQTFYQAKLGQNTTIKKLAESLAVGEQATVYRKVDGQYTAYRVCRITYEGDVEVVPEELADTIKDTDEYKQAVITIEGDTQVMASKDIIDGKIVLYIP